MKGIVIADHLPVLQEFVEAVQERDPDVISACLHYTPPGAMAQIAAQWIHELLETVESQDARIAALQSEAVPAGDAVIAWRAAQRRRYEAETRVERLEAENEKLRATIKRLRAAA